jgi:hypothetical protein
MLGVAKGGLCCMIWTGWLTGHFARLARRSGKMTLLWKARAFNGREIAPVRANHDRAEEFYKAACARYMMKRALVA